MVLLFCLIYGALIVGSYCPLVQLFDGDKCKNTDGYGVCTRILNCPAAVKELKQKHRHNFTRCGFDNFTEIVCCPQEHSIRISERVCKKYKNELYNGTTTRIRSRILGGEDAVEFEFPHMVALGYYDNKKRTYSFRCGSTLISEKYIVTAAHCSLEGQFGNPKIARMGTILVPRETTEVGPAFHDHNVKRAIPHPQYVKSRYQNDIGLVELEQKITFSKNIRPACLYTANDDPEKMVVLGWGRLNYGGLKSTVLQKAEVFSVGLQQCAKMYLQQFQEIIESGQICAASQTSDVCHGDSGGPLQIEREGDVTMLVGVIAFGAGCSKPLPAIYMRIHSHLNWIESIVWK